MWPADTGIRTRVVAAGVLLVGAKAANIAVPFAFKHVVDSLSAVAHEANAVTAADAASAVMSHPEFVTVPMFGLLACRCHYGPL